MDEKKALIVDVNEKPKSIQWLFLSFQHVFAMFGATILVPMLTGFPVSVALFASGVGTLIYTLCTKRKVPVYLGSSFAYITAVILAVKAMNGNISAAQTGLILVGLIYVVVAIVIKFVGKDWIDKLLPPIVIGPMIAVIGLGLAGNAITNAGFVTNGKISYMIIAIVTFLVAALISSQAKGFLKIVPFLVAIIVGYILSLCFGIVDLSGIAKAAWFSIPQFAFPFSVPDFMGTHFREYQFYFGPETLAILPVAIVTISEHIGDHTVLGKICGKNFLKDPGLDRTLIGDGVATAVSAFLGGPANTTYGENTGVIGLTKIGSVYVTCGAAVIAIVLSFCGKIAAVISSIPTCVLGGMSILLYGVIASNGLRILIDAQVDFNKQRNLIIASAMLVIGLGGAVFPLGGSATLSGTALAAIVGVILNLILPDKS
ncbi:uracil-xanthine permease family protein [Candidatus Stoquefichus sp. SB1]|uniref:uracil-xanthine permease family protein n=1 Tax=Candidatus Stoquefichus sp. SB1 TaxID=1658109 RepID=UPI00067EEE3F|nr:solute carrier family 23 protein [Candidatus Stoquefichus sp. SB1]